MTVCADCGGQVDPDVAHHRAACDLDETGFCDCPDLCAACCTDPGCPTRAPQETPTMTDPAVDDVIAWLSIQRRNYIEYPQVCDNYIATIACLRRLVATVEQMRSERDAAYACMGVDLGRSHRLRLLDKGKDPPGTGDDPMTHICHADGCERAVPPVGGAHEKPGTGDG